MGRGEGGLMRNLRESPWLSPIPIGMAVITAIAALELGRPWFRTWLSDHFDAFTVRAVGGGITFVFFAGLIGLLAYLFGNRNA